MWEFFTLFAKFVDKEIVRTRQPGFGGWRFKKRKFEVVVSFFTEHLCHVSSKQTPPSLPPLHFFLVSPERKLIVAIFMISIGNGAILGI